MVDINNPSYQSVLQQTQYLLSKHLPNKPIEPNRLVQIKSGVFKEAEKLIKKLIKSKAITLKESQIIKDRVFQAIQESSDVFDISKIKKADIDANANKLLQNIEQQQKVLTVEERNKQRKIETKQKKLTKRVNRMMKFFGKTGLKVLPILNIVDMKNQYDDIMEQSKKPIEPLTYKKVGKINCIANRLVIFDSSLEHAGFTCTDEDTRVVINFNYS